MHTWIKSHTHTQHTYKPHRPGKKTVKWLSVTSIALRQSVAFQSAGLYLSWAAFMPPIKYSPIGTVPSHHSRIPLRWDSGTTFNNQCTNAAPTSTRKQLDQTARTNPLLVSHFNSVCQMSQHQRPIIGHTLSLCSNGLLFWSYFSLGWVPQNWTFRGNLYRTVIG